LAAYDRLAQRLKSVWLWWTLPATPPRRANFEDIVEDEEPQGVEWHTPDETRRLPSMMSPVNRKKVEPRKRWGRERYRVKP
jgi:DNA (cytosine-5)-methyltransferase 1